MKIFFKIILLGLIISCSGKEDAKPEPKPPIPDKKEMTINLEISKTFIFADGNDVADFIVKRDGEKDVTDSVSFFVNSKKWNDKFIKTDEEGTYVVYAEYLGKKSNEAKIEAKKDVTKNLAIFTSRNKFMADGGDIVSFYVKDTISKTIIHDDKLVFYINGEKSEEYLLQTDKKGVYKITAKLSDKDIDSSASVEAVEEYGINQRVLIEYYTATWCGYCPRLMWQIKKSIKEYGAEFILPIAIHGNDEFAVKPDAGTLNTYFGVKGFPTGNINRVKDGRWHENPSTFKKYIGKDAKVGIAIKSELKDEKITATAYVKIMSEIPNAHVIAVLTQNKLEAKQNGYEGKYDHSYTYCSSSSKDILGVSQELKVNAINKIDFTLKYKYFQNKKDNLYITFMVLDENKQVVNLNRVELGDIVGYNWE